MQEKISKEEFDDMRRRLPAYENIISRVMHCPPHDLEKLQKNIIDIGMKMGLEFHGTQEHSYEENQVFGDIKITGKYTTIDGIRFNVVNLDENGDIIKNTMKQCLTEQELTRLIDNTQ